MSFTADSAVVRASAGARSIAILDLLVAALKRRSPALDGILTVALCGSLGRLEATPESDIDCIIVLRSGVAAAAVEGALRAIAEVFATVPLRTAKSDGIYRQPVAVDALLDPGALGSLSETPTTFGKRIQLLLDARPVYDADAFVDLQSAIVDWYSSDFLEADPGASWTYLLNDLARYLHAYAGWQQFKFARTSDDSWALRQAKFGSSRLLTFAGLFYLLGESNHSPHKREWLKSQLGMTPLARLAAVMIRYDAPAYDRLQAAYDTTFALLSDPRVRAALVAGGPDVIQRMRAPIPAELGQIRAASTVILQVLTRFALDRHIDWDPRFFERWLF